MSEGKKIWRASDNKAREEQPGNGGSAGPQKTVYGQRPAQEQRPGEDQVQARPAESGQVLKSRQPSGVEPQPETQRPPIKQPVREEPPAGARPVAQQPLRERPGGEEQAVGAQPPAREQTDREEQSNGAQRFVWSRQSGARQPAQEQQAIEAQQPAEPRQPSAAQPQAETRQTPREQPSDKGQKVERPAVAQQPAGTRKPQAAQPQVETRRPPLKQPAHKERQAEQPVAAQPSPAKGEPPTEPPPKTRQPAEEPRPETQSAEAQTGQREPASPSKQPKRESPAPRELLPPEHQTDKKVLLAWLIPAIVIFAAGFAAAARWDLIIDQYLYNPSSVYGILFECFGWYPAFLPAILFFGLWAPSRESSTWKRMAGGALAVVGMLVLYYAACHYMEKRSWANGLGDYRTLTWLAAGILVIAVLAVWVFRLRQDTRQRLAFFGLAGTAYLIANQVVVYIVKFIWQRPRFDEMLATNSLADFMPWFHPFGPGGNSFPSAHTANAAGIFMLIVLCDIFPALGKHRKLCYAICWAFIGAMAFARILMGRHFLSDTLAAAGIMALLFFGMRRLKIYKRGCAAARAGTLRVFGRGGA